MPALPRFDATVNWGHVLTAVTLLIAAGGSYYALRNDIHAVEGRVAVVEKAAERMSLAIDRLTSILITTARQDERIKALELRLDAVDRRIDRLEQESKHAP